MRHAHILAVLLLLAARPAAAQPEELPPGRSYEIPDTGTTQTYASKCILII